MKCKSLLVGIGATLLLVACNGGGTTNGSDVQTGGPSTVGTSPNFFTISSLTATGCKSISTNGNCTVSVTYTGGGTYSGPLTLNTLSGYTSTINTCNNPTSIGNTCNFTINNTGGSVSNALPVTIYSNGQSLGISLFVVGGGI